MPVKFGSPTAAARRKVNVCHLRQETLLLSRAIAETSPKSHRKKFLSDRKDAPRQQTRPSSTSIPNDVYLIK